MCSVCVGDLFCIDVSVAEVFVEVRLISRTGKLMGKEGWWW